MQVASLSVKLSANVEQAISGLRKSDAALQKSAVVANKESKKIEGFTNKMKLGWVAVAAGAIASLYAVAKSSAVIGGYFSEFGLLVGYVFDEIGIAMLPVIEPLLDFLFDCADKFAELPDPIKATAGAIIILGTAIPGVLVVLAGLKLALSTLGISGWLASYGINATWLAIAAPIVIGVGLGLAIVALLELTGVLEKVREQGRLLREEGIEATCFYDLGVKAREGTDKVLTCFYDLGVKAREFTDTFYDLGARLREIVVETWDKIKVFTKKTWETIKTNTINIWNAIGAAIWKPIQSAYNKIRDYVNRIINKINSIPVVGTIVSTVSKYMPSLPEFQHGGYVPTTGLAMLHAGEHVTPAGGTTRTSSVTTINYNPTFNITGEMRSDTDLRNLADKLSGIMKDDVRRIIR